jgi:gluconolactonase
MTKTGTNIMCHRVKAYHTCLSFCSVFLALVVAIFSCDPQNAWAQTSTPRRPFKLVASSPAFWELISHDAKLETMATGFGFTEGPVWDASGFVWVSDEELNKIFRVYPDGHREEMLALGDPDGSTYDHEHRLINTASVLRAIIRLSKDGKSYTVLTDRYEGKKFNSPNDVVLGPDGALYFTDPTLDLPKGEKQEIPFQGVYRLDAKGKVTLLTKDLTQPNGLAFSPDGKHLYIDDSEKKNIRVYDFHSDGTISNGRIFGSEEDGTKDGVPDGIRIDRKGNLFVVGPRGIWVWSPEGVHLGTIEVPEQPANLSWGGTDNSVLYITATTSVYKIPTKTHGFVPYD